MTELDKEMNREELANQWDPANPIEQLWTHIARIRAIDPTISDGTVILKTMIALSKSGVFHHYLQTWRDKPLAEQTWAHFKDHFNRADLDRKLTLTTQTAGYHGAHMATEYTKPIAAATGTRNTQTTTPAQVTVDDHELLYCFTHGLNFSHKSCDCERRTNNHKDNATLLNRMGGSEQLCFGKIDKSPNRRRRPAANSAASPSPAPAPDKTE